MDHDRSYKLLFAHPRMMCDLLERFVPGAWVRDADFSTLERVNENHITDDLRARADDIIWRLRCGEQLVYLVVEFQSRSDRFMAVRVLTYVGLLYQDLIRASNSRELRNLPVILPIVLHSGERKWSAVEDLESLLGEVPAGLEPYRPQLRYLLIDAGRCDGAELAVGRNCALMLFRLESCREPEHMRQLVSTLMTWLEAPELESLRRAFILWLGRVVFARLPDEHVKIVNTLVEKPPMLAERVLQWEKDFMEKGRQTGLQEGRQEGRQEGEADMLARLLRKRFGDLPAPVAARLRNASPEQLESWGERVLDALSLDDIFEAG